MDVDIKDEQYRKLEKKKKNERKKKRIPGVHLQKIFPTSKPSTVERLPNYPKKMYKA